MDAKVDTKAQTGWQHDLYDLLRRHNITQFSYVPDAGHSILIDRSLADPEVRSIPLTTEEEGVALIAGADLGGARGVLLMQSSGVGNCINMLSLIKGARFPFHTLESMRGVRISGMAPYLAGTKKALCMPIRKTVESTR